MIGRACLSGCEMADIPNGDYVLKDSGQRQEWTTGSRRDTRAGKGRFDLIPPEFLEALAQLYEAGAIKYGDRNWEKGQPLSRYYDSEQRHMNKWAQGYEDENHLIQAAWNIIGLYITQRRIREGKLPRELGDFGPLAYEDDEPETSDAIAGDWTLVYGNDGR